jgi:tRNA(adenine34) deaminase
MVPDGFDAPGAATSREAVAFWQQWGGQSLMVVGEQDPVLGLPVMAGLQRNIAHCPSPVLLPEAGHFVQEHPQAVLQALRQAWGVAV